MLREAAVCSWVFLVPVLGILWGCSYTPCGPNDPHTMCKYPSGINRFQPWCMGRGASSHEMTDEMRKCTLDAHNHFRQKVAIGDTVPKQPTAANMMKLKYSMEAERIVQHHINSCTSGHDRCRNLRNGTYCGQNIWTTSDGYNVDDMNSTHMGVCWNSVAAYYSEIEYLAGRTAADVENFQFIHDAGHYTAMIWADVSAVGCAWMQAADDNSNPDYTAYPVRAACNYVGLANLMGASNYKVGDNCTECPDGARCSVRYPGLCTFQSEEEEFVDDFSRSPPSLLPLNSLIVGLLSLSILHDIAKIK